MPTNQDTIDSYSDNAAEWAKRKRTNKAMSYTYIERPAMYALLPNMQDVEVLCLGCGSGEECQVLKEKGAGRVVGVDVAKGLIEQAKYAYPDVEFMVMDMERITLPENSFDLVYSSLVLHYVADWRPTLANVFKVLRPGGKFIFSTHHPVRFGAASEKTPDGTMRSTLGFEMHDGSDKFQVFGDYLNAHAVQDLWFDTIKVTYYHRPMGQLIADVLASGFELKQVIEPLATEAAQKIRPEFYAVNQKIPQFLIFELIKPIK